jgi:hypothetical protein
MHVHFSHVNVLYVKSIYMWNQRVELENFTCETETCHMWNYFINGISVWNEYLEVGYEKFTLEIADKVQNLDTINHISVLMHAHCNRP